MTSSVLTELILVKQYNIILRSIFLASCACGASRGRVVVRTTHCSGGISVSVPGVISYGCSTFGTVHQETCLVFQYMRLVYHWQCSIFFLFVGLPWLLVVMG